jgi:hypothetical protein
MRASRSSLLALHVGGGGADQPPGRLLLDRHRLLIRGQVAAVPAQGAVAEVGDLVDQLQQGAVVADDHHDPRPGRDRVVEAAAGVQVQVVGRLVQQQHVGAAQEPGGQAEQDRLAARHLAHAPVQVEMGQPEPVQGGPGALLDVPVVPDGGEAVGGRLAPLDRLQRPAGPGDAEHLVDRQAGVQGQVLGQVAEAARDPHRPARGGELAGQQPQQGRLARPVGPDQAGAAGTDDEAEPFEDDLAVGPGELQVVDDDCLGHAPASVPASPRAMS